MLSIRVRVPNAESSLLQIKNRGGGATPASVIDECQRKLGLHVPMRLYSNDGDLMDCEIEDEMVLAPIYPKGTLVRAVNMLNHPELNGKEGTVLVEKEGKYGVRFDDGSKGLVSGGNLEGIDRRAEAAKQALQELMEETKPAEDAEPTPEPEAPVLSRDERRVLLQELMTECPKVPLRECGGVLQEYAWDVKASVASLVRTYGEEVKKSPYLNTDVAGGASEDPSLRRVAKDETVGGKGGSTVQYFCRRCRHGLCSSLDIKPHDNTSERGKKEFKKKNNNDRLSFQDCGSIFLEENNCAWTEAQANEMRGDLFCPNTKCKAKLGTYNWTGQQCSCGHWVTPAMQLQQSKLDRMRTEDA